MGHGPIFSPSRHRYVTVPGITRPAAPVFAGRKAASYSVDMVNRALTRIVRDVCGWLSGRAGPGAVDGEWLPGGDAICSLEVLLEARENWLSSPDPTLWKTGDAHRLLVNTAAPRLTDAYGLAEHGPSALRVLVDFLDDTDRFHPASMRISALRKELDRAAAKFPAAMADESLWRMAKRIFTAMRAEGVAPADDVAVDAWAAAFSTATAERRRAVLGVLLDRQPELMTCQFVIRDSQVAAILPGMPIPSQLRRHDPDTCEHCSQVPVNPPVCLPSIDELADAARESALVRKMLACGRWAGGGRSVTRRGLPSAADTRSLSADLGVEVSDSLRGHLELSYGWRLAMDAEILRLHRTAVVAGPTLLVLEQAVADDSDPDHLLRVWQDMADIALAGPAQLAGSDASAQQLSEFGRPWGPRALGELYRSTEPIQLDDLVDTMITDYHGSDAGEVPTRMIGAAVRAGLLAGAEAGVVAVTVPADTEIDQSSSVLLGEPTRGAAPILGVRLELTPLGRYLVRLKLLEEESDAPLLESAM
jgi:hypothetical protein